MLRVIGALKKVFTCVGALPLISAGALAVYLRLHHLNMLHTTHPSPYGRARFTDYKGLYDTALFGPLLLIFLIGPWLLLLVGIALETRKVPKLGLLMMTSGIALYCLIGYYDREGFAWLNY